MRKFGNRTSEETLYNRKGSQKDTYAYDAFGRRILVQDKDETALRTLYDGFTFDVIKQSSTFENGLFTDSNKTGIRWSNTGRPTGDRYRYLGDESKDENRYIYLDDNSYKSASTRYRGERSSITVNSTLAAQTTSDYGTDYFTTDLLGSVSAITASTGSQKSSYTYDAFGSLITGDLTAATDFGYLGKQLDPTTALYNYGYRDYTPQLSRFTTVDPIRDGPNWFTYCNGDPVNFVDLWGLEYLDSFGIWRSNTDKTSKLEGAMNNHSDDRYISPDDVKDGEATYRCDDYIQTVFGEAGINNDDYFAGSSQGTTVGEHIKNALKNGIKRNKKENAPILEKGETYVVFMGDSPIKLQDHTGILRKGKNGTIYFTHNSKGNASGGVSTKKFENEKDFQNWYDYDSFYYEKVKTK